MTKKRTWLVAAFAILIAIIFYAYRVTNESRSVSGIGNTLTEAADSRRAIVSPIEEARLGEQEAGSNKADSLSQLSNVDWETILGKPKSLTYIDTHQIDKSIPLAIRYDALVDRSMAGDPNAAIELAGSLSECVDAPRDEKQLNQLIDYTNQTRRVAGNVHMVDDLDGAIQDIHDRFAFCNGTTADQILDHFFYMKTAAENGNIQAKVNLLNYGGMNMRDRAAAYSRVWSNEEEMRKDLARYVKDAVEAGSADAMSKYAQTQEQIGSPLSEVEAAAFNIASSYLKLTSGSVPNEFREMYLSDMDSSVNRLSPTDAEKATSLAAEIIGRDGCCFFLTRATQS